MLAMKRKKLKQTSSLTKETIFLLRLAIGFLSSKTNDIKKRVSWTKNCIKTIIGHTDVHTKFRRETNMATESLSVFHFRPHAFVCKKLNLCLLRRRLIVIVWQPPEHISAPSSKTVGDREKHFWGYMSGATRFTLRWHSHGAVVNDKPCRSATLHVPDRPTGFLHSHNSKTRWPISVIRTLSVSPWDALGPSTVKKVPWWWGGGGDPTKVFVSVHYLRLALIIIIRSGLMPVHRPLIHKEGNEWPSQAEGRGLPATPEVFQPWAPPAQIAHIVRLGRPQFEHTPFLQQERPPIAQLATVCPCANFKSVRQCWVLPHFACTPFSLVACHLIVSLVCQRFSSCDEESVGLNSFVTAMLPQH